MPQMSRLYILETIPMALSANTRKLNEYQNLVLHLDFQFKDDGKRMDSFLAEIHEAAPQDFEKFYPLLPASRNPVFHCYGKRFSEFQAAFAFIDVLFGLSEKSGYRATLESWILALKDQRAISYKVCFKVRDKGILQDPSKPESRVAHEFTRHPPALVPPPRYREDEIKHAIDTATKTAKLISK